MTITLGIIQVAPGKGSVQKRIIAGPDGRPQKDAKHNLGLWGGVAHSATVDGLADVGRLIAGLKPTQALTLGIPAREGVCKLTTGDAWNRSQKLQQTHITRSLKHYTWPADTDYLLLLDHDPEPGRPAMDAAQFWQAITSVMPELATVARLVTVSTSSAIYDKATGECLKPASGHHTYIQVRGDAEQFNAVLSARMWLAGFGFNKLATANAKTGVSAILERAIADFSVFSPERLVYEAGACFEKDSPFEQRRPEPQVWDGDTLDIDALPLPTEAELQRVEELKAAAKAPLLEARIEATVKAVKAAKPSLKPDEVTVEAKARISNAESGTLTPDHIIHLKNGGTVAAGEICKLHHGQACADPQEPSYQGGRRDVATIYWHKPGQWTINSFAHGGCKYRLKQPNRPATLEELDAWVQDASTDPLNLPHGITNPGHMARFIGFVGKTLGKACKGGKDAKKAISCKIQILIHNWQLARARALEAKLRAQQVMSLKAAPVGYFGPITPAQKAERVLYVLNGQKATGKTSGALKALIDACLLAGLSVLYVVPTRNLSRDVATRLGLTHHMEQGEQGAESARYLATCPESLHKFPTAPNGTPWDVVIVDEINEVLPRAELGILGTAPLAARDAFEMAIAEAQTVAIAQDGLYNPVLKAIQRIGGFTAATTQIIERRRDPKPLKVFLYGSAAETGKGADGLPLDNPFSRDDSYYQWLLKIAQAVADGGKIALPTGSRRQGRKVARALKRLFPWIRVQQIDAVDTPTGLRTEFADGPDRWLATNQPDVLIWTPCFNSGVSIEAPYFTHQFEYASALETATNVSQRGERVRAAIGGGFITERHVYIQRRGMPSVPPEEIMHPEYWRSMMSAASALGVKQQISHLKQWGFSDVADAIQDASIAPTEHCPELAEILAIQAREIHHKQQVLMAEWQGNGWEVKGCHMATEGEPTEARDAMEQRLNTLTGGRAAKKGPLDALAELIRRIGCEITQKRAIALTRAPSHQQAETRCPETFQRWQENEEATGPVDIARRVRWEMENKLGDHHLLRDAEFWKNFHLEEHGIVRAAQRRALLEIKWHRPEDWARVMRWLALRTLALHPESAYPDEVPLLPATPALIKEVELIGSCPGLREAISGEVKSWHKATPLISAAHDWAVANAHTLAAITSHAQRWNGLQFNQGGYAIKGFNHLLKLIGSCGFHDGQATIKGKRLHLYRLKTSTDIDRAIDREKAKEEPSQAKIERLQADLYRAETMPDVVAAALNQNELGMTETVVDGWEKVTDYLLHRTSEADNPTSEVLCSTHKKLHKWAVDSLIWASKNPPKDFGGFLAGIKAHITPILGENHWPSVLGEAYAA